jgi:uncharacterized membrane protein YhdT
MQASRVFAFIAKEIREALPPILFFVIGFSLIELTTQLFLDTYMVRLTNYMVALTAALVVGKAVLVADALPFFRRFDAAPLILPILFKTLIYWLVVFVFRILEHLIEYGASGGRLSGLRDYRETHYPWTQFAAVQIWIFTLFLVYTTAAELIALFGAAEVRRIFFGRGPIRRGAAAAPGGHGSTPATAPGGAS